MQNRTLSRAWAIVLVCLVAAAPLWGYVPYTDDSGVYVVKWYQSPVNLQLKLSTTANLIDGNSLSSSVAAATRAWNALLGTVQLSTQASPGGSYNTGNGINEIALDSTVGGMAFSSGAIAITMTYTHGDAVTETDIVFNKAYTWNSYRGNLRNGMEDIQRVALHELGHVLGLDHPDEHGQYVTALMNSRESDLDTLQADDIAGGQKLYGPPGFVPPNNDFASATAITLSDGTLQFTGSNIGATRETGEPNHADSTGLHSVWWKWTAPSNASVTIDTLGSNFDTALAIYTGTSISALATVVFNDDAESSTDNPTPQRKRTSKVVFTAVSGTTYYIAVDGWGGGNSLPDGYTGSITLNVNVVSLIPPTISAQPSDLSVTAGKSASFSVNASGKPALSYRWQRLPAGGSWADLSDGGGYSGTGTSYMSVSTVYSMNGDQFRCVVSNLAGTITSNPATVHVAPIPLPVISIQPQSGKLLTGISGGPYVVASAATSFQWYYNGLPLPGQSGFSLVLPSPQPSDAGDYYVVVSNPGGSVTSAVATITVVPPPVITNNSPTRQVVSPGQALSLSVSATGTGALSYQWFHNGRTIDGANGPSYNRPVNTASDAGAYWSAVTDSNGTRYGAPFFAVLSHAKTNVVAWGMSNDGQDVGATLSSITDAVAISANDSTVIAIKTDGAIQASSYSRLIDLFPKGLNNIAAVSVGRYCALALKADGFVVSTGQIAIPPAGLKEVWSIACGDDFALALKTDGTVVTWGNFPAISMGGERAIAVAAGAVHALTLKQDGTVAVWSKFVDSSQVVPAPSGLNNVQAIAAGGNNSVALKSDGTLVAWGYLSGVPAGLNNVTAIAAGAYHLLALKTDGTVIDFAGSIPSPVPAGLHSVFAICSVDSGSLALRDVMDNEAPLITSQPTSQVATVGWSATISVFTSGYLTAPSYQWQHNGQDIPAASSPLSNNGSTTRSFTVVGVQPSDTGFYSAVITSGGSATSAPAVIGVISGSKVIGTGTELQPVNILHPNGNIFDQVLLTGAAEAIMADQNQVTRTSFIDLNDDIVQVEFSGAGTLALVLDNPTGPAAPANYNQPAVGYMKGHAGIVIAGADATTNVSIFTVGRATAVDPTGGFNVLLPISATNNPANNGSSLFQGHSSTTYDGVADIAFVAILSTNGRFGGLRAANTSFFATKGYTGVYAPGVRFTGPVYVGDISASATATPVLLLGSASDTQITGGDLLQANGQPLQVSGITKLKFVAGSTSQGTILPAQANKAVLQQNGVDVTSQVVVNPGP